VARGSACSYPSAVQSCPTVAPDALHRASVVSRAQLARRRKIPILIGSPPVSSASQSSIQRQRDAMQLSSSFSVKASDRRAGNGHDSRCVVSCRSKCNSWFDFIFPQATPGHAVTSLKNQSSSSRNQQSGLCSGRLSGSVMLSFTASVRLAPATMVQPLCEVTQLSEQCGRMFGADT
jgi:hypothetical protein